MLSAECTRRILMCWFVCLSLYLVCAQQRLYFNFDIFVSHNIHFFLGRFPPLKVHISPHCCLGLGEPVCPFSSGITWENIFAANLSERPAMYAEGVTALMKYVPFEEW